MNIRVAGEALLLYGFYPAWMFAGLGDYLAHRRSAIETTSGINESWLHILEFLTMAAWLVLIVFFHMTLVVLLISVVCDVCGCSVACR